MPDRRPVLPRDVTGAHAFTCTGCTHVDDGESPVVLVLPSLTQMLQAAWLEALRAGEWAPFDAWLEATLADRAPASRPTWRYDLVLADWVRAAGAGRVRVVVGPGRSAATATLAAPSGGPMALEGWPRTLTWAEVAMVQSLVGELEELGLTGRNATEMVHGGGTTLMASTSGAPVGQAPLSAALRDRLAAVAEEMAAALDASGVLVSGDRSALVRLDESDHSGSAVGLAEAAALASGVLERVSTWGDTEETA